MVSRYGEFVLYRPPLRPATYLLWGAPFTLLLIGMIVLYRSARSSRAAPAEAADPTASDRARRLLQQGDDR
jgi:cytochrome c-type biogenesis protein CcmH